MINTTLVAYRFCIYMQRSVYRDYTTYYNIHSCYIQDFAEFLTNIRLNQ